MKRLFLFLFAALLAIGIFTNSALAIENTETISSVVYIEVDYGNDMYAGGSGFLISQDGLILTNSHVVVDPDTGMMPETIYICVIDDEFSIPTCFFTAEIVAYDEWLDLALLAPAYYVDETGSEYGEMITPEDFIELNAPYVDFADYIPTLGDDVTILGFPEASGSYTVVLTEGTVSAFTPLYEDIIWYFTTDATINPGNSGGPVYNEEEKVVGVAWAVSTNEVGGNYGYVISNEAVLLWFFDLVEAGVLNEEFVTTVFSNDYVNDFQEYDIEELEDVEIFDDVRPEDVNSAAILYLKNTGIINGYPDGTFKPANPLNRAELLKILVEGKGISPDASTYKNCFPDVGTEWFAKYVCYAKNQGWIEGYPDGTFKPANDVNKVEALKMLLETFGIDLVIPEQQPFNDVYVFEWYAKYVNTANNLGLLEETGSNYWPGASITRGQVSENLYRLLLYVGA